MAQPNCLGTPSGTTAVRPPAEVNHSSELTAAARRRRRREYTLLQSSPTSEALEEASRSKRIREADMPGTGRAKRQRMPRPRQQREEGFRGHASDNGRSNARVELRASQNKSGRGSARNPQIARLLQRSFASRPFKGGLRGRPRGSANLRRAATRTSSQRCAPSDRAPRQAPRASARGKPAMKARSVQHMRVIRKKAVRGAIARRMLKPVRRFPRPSPSPSPRAPRTADRRAGTQGWRRAIRAFPHSTTPGARRSPARE